MSKMIVCDLSAIEHRVVGWVARCPAILRCHELKHDPYLDFAPYLYPEKRYTYEMLEAAYNAKEAWAKDARQMAKPPVLGGGFGLGGGNLIKNSFGDMIRTGLWGYALNVCGVDMPRELAHKAVLIYRKINDEVVQFWADMEQAFKSVLETGEPMTVGQVTWNKQTKAWNYVFENKTGAYITFSLASIGELKVMRMQLPSGRFLHYINPRVEKEKFKYTDKKTGEEKTAVGEVIYYDGIEHSATTDEEGQVEKKAHKWGKTKTYGGKLTENAVQAIARDVLVNGNRLARGMGFKVFGLFHDEIATLVDNALDAPTLEDLRWCMSQSPEWGPTLLLDAAGYTGTFYKKG